MYLELSSVLGMLVAEITASEDYLYANPSLHLS